MSSKTAFRPPNDPNVNHCLYFAPDANGFETNRFWLKYDVANGRGNPTCACNSACFFIIAGAVERLSSNSTGVHRPYFDKNYFESLSPSQARIEYERMKSYATKYLREMNIPESIIDLIFSVSSNDIRDLTHAEDMLIRKLPWIEETYLARCGKNLHYSTAARTAYSNCYSRLSIELFDQAVPEYLARYGSDERTTQAGNRAPATTTQQVSTFRHYANRDMLGRDIGTLRNVAIDVCQNECENNQQCRAFVYDKWNKFCFLKSTIGRLRLEPKSVVGISSGERDPQHSRAAEQMDQYLGKLFPGTGYATINVTSLERCESMCESAHQCVAYSYFRRENKCRLMETAGEYFSATGVDSGVKRQPAPH